MICGAILFMYPFIWMMSATLAPENEIGKLVLFPSKFLLKSYLQVIDKIPIGRAFLNSVFVTLSITAGVIVFGSMIGYALSRLQFRGRNIIFFVIIFTMTLPFQITLIPQYIIMVKFGWVDTYLALIVPYLINSFAIILFRQHYSICNNMVDIV